MQDSYVNQTALLESTPPVAKQQIEFMQGLDFNAVCRKENLVLWELKGWPELCIWIQGSQTNLSVKYIMMEVFKAGLQNGKVFQINEFRLNLGFPTIPREDVERLSSFDNPWLGCYMNPRHES